MLILHDIQTLHDGQHVFITLKGQESCRCHSSSKGQTSRTTVKCSPSDL